MQGLSLGKGKNNAKTLGCTLEVKSDDLNWRRKKLRSRTREIKEDVSRMMEMVKEKPRRRSVSELLNWRCLAECKDTIAGNGNDSAGGLLLEDRDRESEARRRRRSGTWP